MNPELENNRFEIAWQKLKRRIPEASFLKKWGKWTLVFLICLELLGTISAIMIESRRGTPFDILSRHYWITRFSITPFITEETIDDIESKTGTRYIGDRNSPRYKPQREDALLGWRPPAGTSYTTFASLQAELGWIWNATSKQGFAVTYTNPAEYMRPKPKGVYRILFMGGSTMYGTGSHSFDSISSQFMRILEEKRYSGIEVINAGVSGFHSSREFLYFMTELYSYEPDLVILYGGWNDCIRTNVELKKYAGYNMPGTELRLARHEELSLYVEDSRTLSGAVRNLFSAIGIQFDSLYVRSGIFFLVKEGEKAINGLKVTTKNHLRSIGIDSEKPSDFHYYPEAVSVYQHNIERFLMLSKQYGFELGVFLQPVMGVDSMTYRTKREQGLIDSELGQQTIAQLNKFYADSRIMYGGLAKDEKFSRVCLKDISNVFAKVQEPVYVDTGHLNATGNRIVAQKMFDTLASCNLLPPSELTKEISE